MAISKDGTKNLGKSILTNRLPICTVLVYNKVQKGLGSKMGR